MHCEAPSTRRRHPIGVAAVKGLLSTCSTSAACPGRVAAGAACASSSAEQRSPEGFTRRWRRAHRGHRVSGAVTPRRPRLVRLGTLVVDVRSGK